MGKIKRIFILLLILVFCWQATGCVLRKFIPEPSHPEIPGENVSSGASEPGPPKSDYRYSGEAGDLAFYSYSLLNESQKELYSILCSSIEAYTEEIDGPFFFTPEEFDLVVYAVFSDHPEYFWADEWCGEYWVTTINGKKCIRSYQFHYLMKQEDVAVYKELIETQSQKILAEAAKQPTEYLKAKYLHDYIIEHASYNSAAADKIDQPSHLKGKYTVPKEYFSAYSILGFFTRSQIVCSGYAKLFQYLLARSGMYALYVTGDSREEGHAWNIVQIDGDYYHFDLTWDDPVSESEEADMLRYDYFAVTTAEIEKDHQLDSLLAYPDCLAETYHYYRYNNLFLETYDYDCFYQGMQTALAEGNTEVSFQFSSPEVSEQCQRILFAEEAIFDMLAALPSSFSSLDRELIYSNFDQDKLILSITFAYLT